MKSFFGRLFAVLVGLAVFFILSLMIIGGIVSASSNDEAVELEEKSMLLLKFDKQLADKGEKAPVEIPGFERFMPATKTGLNDILKALEHAKTDDKLDGIVLRVSGLNGGKAIVQEIRDALLDFKSSGKYIYAYSTGFSQSAYYLCSVADSVFLQPEGSLEWKGISYQTMFFKEALAKLGLEPQIIRHGTFKAAVEPFLLTGMSEANRLQSSTFIGSLWKSMVDAVAKSRSVTAQQLNDIADNMKVYDAKTAVEHKLVDALMYRDQFMELLMSKAGAEAEEDLEFVSLGKYLKSIPRTVEQRSKDKIAVLYGAGSIVDGKGGKDNIAAIPFAKEIRELRADSSIKAVVLRINSPGGSALASDIIWREIELLKKVKPVVVSMGDLAASGGYYIACNSDYIFAQPSTLTGSIGVFGMFFTAKNLLENKLGIYTDGVKTNKHADILSMARPLDAEERALIQKSVENVYGTFTSHVADGRKMDLAKVMKLGEGRVWSGANALENGLVDAFGGLRKAQTKAAELAKLEDYRIVEFPKKKDVFQEFIKGLESSVSNSIIENRLGESYKYVNRIEQLKGMQGIQARLPFLTDVE